MAQEQKKILIVTNRQDYTADFVVLKLQERAIGYVRLNTEDFPQRVSLTWSCKNRSCARGVLTTSKERTNLGDIASVWFRRPVPPAPSSEITDAAARELAAAESSAALDGLWASLDCMWVSPPDRLRVAEQKPLQLKAASELGLSIPRTLISNDPNEVRTFCEGHAGDIVVKPLRAGQVDDGETLQLIYTNVLTKQQLGDIDSVKLAPCLFQERVEKKADIRVIVFGTAVFAFEIKSQEHESTQVDWRRDADGSLRYVVHELPRSVSDRCVRLVSELGLAFGAIDLVLSKEDRYVFLEINPNGQWAWLEQITGVPLSDALLRLLARA